MKNYILAVIILLPFTRVINAQQSFYNRAQTQPMGWNSYDCFGAAVAEKEVRSNAKIMEMHLKDAGWQYVVVDYQWFYPYPGNMQNCPQTKNFSPSLAMDQYGRLLPTSDRFPSAVDGNGFKPLADYIHSLGLKFGIHVMRGVPRESVHKKLPIKGTNYTADQVVDTQSICTWLNNMYGLDMAKPGAQEYLNSLFELYAAWGVDFVKIDDMQGQGSYYAAEIEGYRKAIDNCGRPIVFSVSPRIGYEEAHGHIEKYANMWRISGDFWDNWGSLKKQFNLLHQWEKSIGDGHFPDADMIPFGILNQRGPHDSLPYQTHFTRTEQYTLMSLWAIARSPLMYGGDLMGLRNFELGLLTNKEVIAVNQSSSNNRQLFYDNNQVAWVADVPDSSDKYIAIFDLNDSDKSEISVDLSEIGFIGETVVRDLWKNRNLQGKHKKEFKTVIELHGSGLYRISRIT